jgi:hypothetical protein
MVVDLCVINYVTFDGFVNGVDNIFETSKTCCDNTIIWITFQNYKIGILKEKYNHYYNIKIQLKWTLIEYIITNI